MWLSGLQGVLTMPRTPGRIEKRGDNKFLRVFTGRDGNGKRQYVNKTFHGTSKQAQKGLRQMLLDKDSGVLVGQSDQKLNDYLAHWLTSSKKAKIREHTYDEYKKQLDRYITPVLGERKLSQITPLAIQDIYSKMLERGLSPRTVILTHTIFSNALKQAVKWRVLPYNPGDAVELPKYVKPEMIAFSQEESNRFLEAIRDYRWELFLNLLISTGLRPSEAIALKWDDLDLSNSRLSVKHTLSKTNGVWRYEEPKTPKSRRTIDIPLGLTKMLAKQEIAPGLVFHNGLGEPVYLKDIYDDHYKPALKRAKLDEAARLYDLRHTCATLLLLAGDYTQQLHIKLVSEYLGHSNIQITIDTYGHVLPGMHKAVAAKMHTLLFDVETSDEAALYN
jgi:integrase